ncbi:hypothetical protein QWZ06_16195 [Chryseobacterium tructae]|uniref:Uncharacterized protein n=1 Tax=Chryseobacterium tructae TaxID=1037380 RepID=A0ABV7Y0S5_9FLAO|nr:hypothetical protein [Chryseobacterium tructae]MDN3693725.1 hypothetical protein [Chryseobacterium tructae]
MKISLLPETCFSLKTVSAKAFVSACQSSVYKRGRIDKNIPLLAPDILICNSSGKELYHGKLKSKVFEVLSDALEGYSLTVQIKDRNIRRYTVIR